MQPYLLYLYGMFRVLWAVTINSDDTPIDLDQAEKELTLKRVAARCHGYTAADLQRTCAEAALNALKRSANAGGCVARIHQQPDHGNEVVEFMEFADNMDARKAFVRARPCTYKRHVSACGAGVMRLPW